MTPEITIYGSDFASVSSTQDHALGLRAHDSAGNEYVYVKGVTNGVVGAAATFDETGTTALVVSGAAGPVCIFGAILAASKYGWGLIWGTCDILLAEAVDDNDLVNITATPGAVGDTSTTRITNAIFREAGASGLVAVQVAYPTLAM